MNYFELGCKMFASGAPWSDVAGAVAAMKDEINAGKAPRMVQLAGDRASITVPDSLIKLLAMVEHYANKDTLPHVVICAVAYLKRDPDILDQLADLYPQVQADETPKARRSRRA